MIDPHRTRAEFAPTGGEAAYAVAGRAVRAEQLACRSMNFGQQWRTPGIADHPYTVSLPVSFFLHVLRRDLPDFVEDSTTFPGDGELETTLREHGWPGAEAILSDPELAGLALDYFAHDLLLEWLGDGPPDELPGWVLNTVDERRVEGGAVVLAGKAREAGIPVAYQDV